jgi:hypothetical protein
MLSSVTNSRSPSSISRNRNRIIQTPKSRPNGPRLIPILGIPLNGRLRFPESRYEREIPESGKSKEREILPGGGTCAAKTVVHIENEQPTASH